MNRIKSLRKSRNLTLEEMVNELLISNGGQFKSITSTTLGRYERGEREPKLDTWQKLADYFGVSVPYLQGLADSPQGFVYQAPTNEEVWQFHEAHTLEEISDADTDAAYTELIALVKKLTSDNIQADELTDIELAQGISAFRKAVLTARAFTREQIEIMDAQQSRSNEQ
ncbi:helix-turn-helix domain-containing protein [Weissella confusa]|uniref:helix-turn-helix domain-containing protein n=1 Tax=Weissella confusa TaxID=1583 RepID=UPI0018F1E1E1|nr:helix-turn-helix transcriptional regulator [Weissella confusa]MBJ7649659.1 helix-turn-helix transcriptional regulator [Weissella confusa]MCS9989954.1 XRE family transcriptional regulator [Weissella confusa]